MWDKLKNVNNIFQVNPLLLYICIHNTRILRTQLVTLPLIVDIILRNILFMWFIAIEC